ncbi:hypothetical protein ACWKSR_12070, partial [Campylobacter fetus subsp. venerealis]
TYMMEDRVQGPTTLAVLAKKYGVPVSQLEEFNLWTRNGKIPGDRVYTVVYIKDGSAPIQQAVVAETNPSPNSSSSATSSPAYKQAN